MLTKNINTDKYKATFEKWAPMQVKPGFVFEQNSNLTVKVTPTWFQNGTKSGPKASLETLRKETPNSENEFCLALSLPGSPRAWKSKQNAIKVYKNEGPILFGKKYF